MHIRRQIYCTAHAQMAPCRTYELIMPRFRGQGLNLNPQPLNLRHQYDWVSMMLFKGHGTSSSTLLIQERRGQKGACKMTLKQHHGHLGAQKRRKSKGDVGCLRLVGSFKLQVSFAEYSLFYRTPLQKRPIIVRILAVATPQVFGKGAQQGVECQRRGEGRGGHEEAMEMEEAICKG